MSHVFRRAGAKTALAVGAPLSLSVYTARDAISQLLYGRLAFHCEHDTTHTVASAELAINRTFDDEDKLLAASEETIAQFDDIAKYAMSWYRILVEVSRALTAVGLTLMASYFALWFSDRKELATKITGGIKLLIFFPIVSSIALMRLTALYWLWEAFLFSVCSMNLSEGRRASYLVAEKLRATLQQASSTVRNMIGDYDQPISPRLDTLHLATSPGDKQILELSKLFYLKFPLQGSNGNAEVRVVLGVEPANAELAQRVIDDYTKKYMDHLKASMYVLLFPHKSPTGTNPPRIEPIAYGTPVLYFVEVVCTEGPQEGSRQILVNNLNQLKPEVRMRVLCS